MMEVLVKMDSSVQGPDVPALDVEGVVRHALARFADHITRVEAHLADENAGKSGADDKRCVLEARVAGRPPTAVSHHAPDLTRAVTGAADKLKRALDTEFGRRQSH
jgi:hypothetical protein